jgi:hypothetical protein
MLGERRKQASPPVRKTQEQDLVGEAVARSAAGGDLVEAAMLDADPGLLADSLESHLNLGVKVWRKVRLAIGED